MMANTERVGWIDAARGLGIIAIVLGHAYVPVSIEILPPSYWALFSFVYAFHVPLFMALSGLVFNPRRFGFVALVKSRAVKIVLPYLFWAVVSALLFLSLGSIAGEALGRRVSGEPILLLRQVLFANPSDNGMRWNTPLWFLTALMVAQVMHWLLAKAVSVLKLPDWVGLVLSILVAVAAYFTMWGVALPWSIERALVLLPFVSVGSWLGPQAKTWVPTSKLRWGVAGTVLSVCTSFVAMANGLVDYVAKGLNNPFLWLLGAAFGIAATMSLAVVMSNCGWLTWVGRASMTILVVHKFPLVAMQLVAGKLPIDYSTIAAPIAVTVMAALTLVFGVLLHPIIMRLAPWSIGASSARVGGPKPRRAR